MCDAVVFQNIYPACPFKFGCSYHNLYGIRGVCVIHLTKYGCSSLLVPVAQTWLCSPFIDSLLFVAAHINYHDYLIRQLPTHTNCHLASELGVSWPLSECGIAHHLQSSWVSFLLWTMLLENPCSAGLKTFKLKPLGNLHTFSLSNPQCASETLWQLWLQVSISILDHIFTQIIND